MHGTKVTYEGNLSFSAGNKSLMNTSIYPRTTPESHIGIVNITAFPEFHNIKGKKEKQNQKSDTQTQGHSSLLLPTH